jgi:hypothetical protein
VSLTKRKYSGKSVEPFPLAPHITVEDNYDFKGQIITPGTEIRIYGIQGTFKYRRTVTNHNTGSVWIDCMSNKRGSFHSFFPERISRVVKKRKFRQKVVKIGS